MQPSHLLGLIGFPLTHSFSKGYFRDKFKKEKIENYTYENFPLQYISNVLALIENHPNLKGFNVTIPYKEQIIAYLDEIDGVAAKIGAVNTVKINEGRLKGYNTDVYGFQTSLLPFLDKNTNYHALILGTGGASKAVAFVLKQLKIPFQYVSRQKEKTYLNYENLDTLDYNRHWIIINTTPLGTYPELNSAPLIPYKKLNSHHLLYDLVYNPEKTLFLKRAQQQGAKIKNGLEMLHLQAEKAWEIWR